MTRIVGHRCHGPIEVYALAQTISEALAIEAAIRAVPPAEAFQPPVIDESQLPPAAFASEEDNAAHLKNGEAFVEPVMEHAP